MLASVYVLTNYFFFYGSDINHFLLEYLRIWLHPVTASYPYITATQIKRYRNVIPKFNIPLPQFPLLFQGFVAKISSSIQVSILYLFSLTCSHLPVFLYVQIPLPWMLFFPLGHLGRPLLSFHDWKDYFLWKIFINCPKPLITLFS